MLFLRDIDADVQLRCRACGHGGVLPRAMLERRFGPNYPVLSIAPHYRCSRCDSRDTESRPILAVPAAPTAAPAADEPSFDAPLAALNGLLASLRGDNGPDRAVDRDPPAPPPPPARAKPLSERPLSDLVADGPGDGEAEPLWEPVSLADMAARLGRSSPPDEWDDKWDDDPEEEPAAGDSRGPTRFPANDALPEPAPAGAPDDVDDDEDGDDETLMAMRQLLAQAYGSDDEFDEDQEGEQEDGRNGAMPQPPAGRAANAADRRPADDFAGDSFSGGLRGGLNGGNGPASGPDDDEPPAFSHKVLVRRDFEDEWADSDTDGDADPWAADAEDDDREDGFDDGEPDGEEPSEEDILSFAIRDPEKPATASRPAKPVPAPAAEPLDFDQHRAERRALRPPPPEDEEGFDRTLAALRSMIEDAASETEEDAAPLPPPTPPPPRRTPRGAGQTADRSAVKPVDKPLPREEEDEPPAGRDDDDDDGWSLPAGWGDPDPAPEPPVAETASPDAAPAGRRSAQEREIEEAMKALRGLIEDEVNADPPASPPASPSAPPPVQPKPRAGKPRQSRGGPAAPDAVRQQSVQAPEVAPPEEDLSGKPVGEPTPLSKTIAALRGMLELDGRRKR
ncbi:hypothetical protein [Azospirillum sp. TSH64]|uniref:hypothetical protein n=1 Tax=Azospirillum sp. TSH64 TaxID=652740 RepID=UPI0011B1F1E7|nr:hypothetical protein [Azospirillum sp. TSH64]